MKKTLPINKNAYPMCFSNDAHINTILSNEECVDVTLATIDELSWKTSNECIKHYNNKSNNVELIVDESSINFRSNFYDTNMQAVLYNKIQNKIEICFKVSKHLRSTPWAKVGVFFRKDPDKPLDLKNGVDFDYFFGCCCKTGFFSVNDNENSDTYVKFPRKEYWLRVKIKDKRIFSSYSFDGYAWLEYDQTDIDVESNSIAGIFIDFDQSDYYNWLFQNYIQIHCCANLKDTYDGPPVEFFHPIQKDYNYYLVHPLIDFRLIPKNIAIKHNIIEFVKQCIDNNEYLEVILNQYYIESHWAYQRQQFDHANLVYGYDDDKEIIYMMGFDKKGLYIKQEIEYKDFERAFIESNSVDYLTLFKQDYSYSPYRIDVGRVIMYLKDYIYSTNSSNRLKDICTTRDRVFGISFYDCVLSNETNLKCFCDDIRISHLLYEHKKCMKERIVYLHKRGYLSEDDYANIYPISKSIEAKSIILRNLVLKRKNRPNIESTREANIMNKAYNTLKEIYSIEKEYLPMLIQALEKNYEPIG